MRRGFVSLLLRIVVLWVALGEPAGTAQPVRGGTDSPTEHQVKAAFLYNFARLTEWPKSAFENAKSEFVVAVLEPDPFGKNLERAFAGKRVDKRNVRIVRYKRAADVKKCHILFVPAKSAGEIKEVRKALGDAKVLIVGESPRFAERGGVVNFFIEKKRLRFEINRKAAEAAGLKISSHLLKLARIVGDDDEDEEKDKKKKKGGDEKPRAPGGKR